MELDPQCMHLHFQANSTLAFFLLLVYHLQLFIHMLQFKSKICDNESFEEFSS